MVKYLIIGKNGIARCVRDRGVETLKRFPDWTIIASGGAKSVKDAHHHFNEIKSAQ